MYFSACLSCGMVVLLITAGCRLFHSLMVLGKKDDLYVHLCGHIAGYSVEYSEWLVVVGMLASWCLILYSMLILECRRRCCSVGRSRC